MVKDERKSELCIYVNSQRREFDAISVLKLVAFTVFQIETNAH